MADLLERFQETLRAGRLLPARGPLIAAVSGGVDSMVLLDLLARVVAPRRLIVAHFNHQLRGRSSEADERFVRAQAGRLKLRCVTGRAEVRRYASRDKVSVEMAARTLRHAFLARVARRFRSSQIALAHHADDQVELFFLRLLRGASPRGLGGMSVAEVSPVDRRVTLVRPLLQWSKADLTGHAQTRRLPFREDASNSALDFLRNRVRHELLPLLRRRFQPAVDEVVLRTMVQISGESCVVQSAAAAWSITDKHAPPFSKLPAGIQRAVIERGLIGLGVAPSFKLIETLRGVDSAPVTISPGKRLQADGSGGVEWCGAASSSEFKHEQQSVDVSSSGSVEFAGSRFNWRRRRTRNALKALATRGPGMELLDAGKVGDVLRLRHWRRGDRYQPAGLAHEVKLQDWFVNRKVPRARRHELVLAETAGGVLCWVEGQRLAEPFKLTAETREILEWRWQRAGLPG